MSTVSAIFSAIANGFRLGWALVTGRNAQAERANTPEMRVAAQARDDQAEADRARATVAAAQKTGDLDALRKEASE